MDQLLDVTRAELDSASFRAEPLNLGWLLGETADRCEIEAGEKGRKILLHLTVRGKINGDPELLRCAIENVLRNAIRHGPADAPIELSAHGEQDCALITVSDRGPGVPDEALEASFQPFYRVDDDRGRSTGGTGLGLAIARRAIVLHRGSIIAKNQGPGLRVEIRIPRN